MPILGIIASQQTLAPTVTGGTLYTDSTYNYRKFTGNGTLTVSGGTLSCDILVIAGGGGGGGDIIATTLHNSADATSQANFYLGIRAFPQDVFESITFTLGNSELDDSDRDALLNVFMGLPLDIMDLPANMVNGRFQGFVEGWTFRAGYNRLDITLNVSPTAFSLQSMQWDDVSVTETWNTLSNTLDWNEAIIVA